jgi:IS66 C-terminal element/Transposase IS66 family
LVATFAAEGKQGAAERILGQHLLGQHRQPVHALTHIGVAAGQPYMHARRQSDHPRSATKMRRKARGSTCTSTRSVVPVGKTISIKLAGWACLAADVDAARLLHSAQHRSGVDDGRIELDTNSVERAMRPVCLSRKNSLFAGSDEGGENWACLASLIETCKLNQVNPQAYFTDLLTRLVNGWPQKRIDELMPWNWMPEQPP